MAMASAMTQYWMCSQSRVGMPPGPDQLALSVNQSHVSEKMFIAPPACGPTG